MSNVISFVDSVIDVRQVKTRKDLLDFILLPRQIYGNTSHGIPSIPQELKRFSKRRNPFFEHSDAALFVAYQKGNPVGRIAAIHNGPHEALYRDKTGFFGFFETVPQYLVAKKLFDAAQVWCASQGKTTLAGPVNFSIYEEYGLLVSGFSQQPFVLMPYHPPYYMQFLERYQFHPSKDLYVYHLDLTKPSQTLQDVDRLTCEYPTCEALSFRRITTRNLTTTIEQCFTEVFNSEWQQQYGYVPISKKELHFRFQTLRKWVIPDWLLVGEVYGRLVGCMMILPNVYEITHKFKGFWGWVHPIVAPFMKHHIWSAKCILLMIKNDFRQYGFHLHFLKEAIVRMMNRNIQVLELGWIPQDHVATLHTLTKFHLHPAKTYRLYSKKIPYPYGRGYPCESSQLCHIARHFSS